MEGSEDHQKVDSPPPISMTRTACLRRRSSDGANLLKHHFLSLWVCKKGTQWPHKKKKIAHGKLQEGKPGKRDGHPNDLTTYQRA